jgi:hypothetical protein
MNDSFPLLTTFASRPAKVDRKTLKLFYLPMYLITHHGLSIPRPNPFWIQDDAAATETIKLPTDRRLPLLFIEQKILKTQSQLKYHYGLRAIESH